MSFHNAQVTSSIDSTSIKIGEEINIQHQVQADSTDLVVFPEGQTFLPLEVIESYKIDTTNEKAKYRLIKKYGLTQFDSGKYTLPPQQVIINDKRFLTDSVKVEVRDVVVDTTKQKMFDIKPAIEVEKPPFDLKELLVLVDSYFNCNWCFWIFFIPKKKEKRSRREAITTV